MRLFKSQAESRETQSTHAGASALLDGAAAAVHGERLAGSHAALALGVDESAFAAHAAARWRTGDRGDATPLRHTDCGGEAAALAAAAGMAETGLRATAFVSSASLTALHEILYGMAGKHLPLVIHCAAETAPRAGHTALAGHDGYHAVADAGWLQAFAWDAQSSADLALISRRIAEQALLPALVAQDLGLTTHCADTLMAPEPALAQAYLGRPGDMVASPTPAQRLLFGEQRPRLPALFSLERPLLTGAAHGPGTAAEAIAAQQPYTFAHAGALVTRALEEYAALTGRTYAPALAYRCDDADYLLIAQGSLALAARAAADHLRQSRRLRVGVVTLVFWRPFPGAALAELARRRKGVLVLERLLQPLAEDPPLLGALRGALGKALENGRASQPLHPDYPRLRRAEEVPPLYGLCCGLAGRAVAVGALAAAVEGLLPGAPPAGWASGVLGVDFLSRESLTPKQAIFAQQLADAYPELTTPTAPAPVPLSGACIVRVLGAQGRAPFTLDAHLGIALHALGLPDVRAWPAAASPRTGSPSTFTIVAGPVAAPALDDALPADVLAVCEPEALRDSALLAGLKPGGVLLWCGEGDAETPAPEVRAALAPLLEQLAAAGIGLFHLPGTAMAAEEARDAEGQRRALGLLLQGALLASPPLTGLTALEGRALLRALKSAWLALHPNAEAADIESDLNLLQRGAEGLRRWQPSSTETEPAPPEEMVAAAHSQPAEHSPELRTLPPHPVPVYDLHRHYAAHPQFHRGGAPMAHAADPFVGAGLLPAATGLLRDQATTRRTYPHWLPERCTGCGACWAICPDAALPALVNTTAEVLETGQRLMAAHGLPGEHLPRAVRVLEGKWRARLQAAGPQADAGECLAAAIAETIPAAKATADEQPALAAQLEHLHDAVQPFPLARPSVFFGPGGLLSITLDPERCKGCGACRQACPEQAIELRPQTAEALAGQRTRWNFWLGLPNTAETFRRNDDGRSEAPTCERLLLDRRVYRAMVGGNEGNPGTSENTTLHLLSAAAQAVLQPRVDAHVQRLSERIEALEQHIRLRLAVDVSDVDALSRAVQATGKGDLTLDELARRVDPERTPIDPTWLNRVTETLSGLRHLRDAASVGESGRPRAALGMVAAIGAETAALAPYPFNAYAFPWSGQDPAAAPAALEGVLHGHLARVAEGYRLSRIAELELAGRYNPELHDAFFAGFGWPDFSPEEWELCPPLVLLLDDAALHRESAGAVLALLRGPAPVKVLCLTGGGWQALAAQPGTPPPFGEALPGMEEAPQRSAPAPGELALLAAAQGTAYVEQGSLADVPRLLDGFLRGLASPRPALFRILRASLPSHSGADALAAQQSLLALRSRAHPALRFDPDAGAALHEQLSLAGNPAPGEAFVPTPLEHLDAGGHGGTAEVALTFAHFALTVQALAHHFAPAAEGERGELTPLTDYLALDAEERREVRPYIEAADITGRLRRWAVSAALVRATEQRKAFWEVLRTLVREDLVPVDEAAIADRARGEVVERVWRNLMELAQGNGGAVADTLTALAGARPDGSGEARHG